MTSDIDRLMSHRHKDWRALMRTRANVLVTGPQVVLDGFVGACQSEVRKPVIVESAGGPLSLRSSRTLVITDLHLIDLPSQRVLSAWIRTPENADTQIISLTCVPLFPFVHDGRFDRDLFYRLNTIHLELNSV